MAAASLKENVIVAVALFCGATFFLFGLPMTMFAWHWSTLTLAYCGIAATFGVSAYFAMRASRTRLTATGCCLTVIALAFVVGYGYYWLWLTN
jgi:hypothetical protein